MSSIAPTALMFTGYVVVQLALYRVHSRRLKRQYDALSRLNENIDANVTRYIRAMASDPDRLSSFRERRN